MIKVCIGMEIYKSIEPIMDRCQLESDRCTPGMIVAQICTGPETGSMNVFFLPQQVALEIQEVLARHSKTPVAPGTVKFSSQPPEGAEPVRDDINGLKSYKRIGDYA